MGGAGVRGVVVGGVVVVGPECGRGSAVPGSCKVGELPYGLGLGK